MKPLATPRTADTGLRRLQSVGLALISLWLLMVLYTCTRDLVLHATLHHYESSTWGAIRSNTVYIWLPWLALIPFVLLIAARVPVHPGAGLKVLFQHLGFMLVTTLAHGYLSAWLYYEIGLVDPDMVGYEVWQHAGHFLFDGVLDMFLLDGFIYTFLIASQNLRNFHHLVRQNELDAARMQGQLAESKLQALKMQINPHFLFNTLNSIAVLVKQGENAKAGAMIGRLSDFFRQTLEQGEQQAVSLRQELALIEHYLAIEQVRFGERLAVEYHVDPACLDVQVPALILQPLVENAIKHGLAKKTGPCRLAIRARRAADGVAIDVVDNGIGTLTRPRMGVGLRNVSERLQAFYAERHRFHFTSTPEEGTAIRLVLGGSAA